MSSRILRPLAVLAAVYVLLLLAWYWPHVRDEFFVVIGNRDEAGGWYGWWSGNAGGLQIFEWIALGALIYWHRTCHQSTWCLRPGKYEAAGGMFRLCRHHHPDLRGARPHRDLIGQLHRDWRERAA